MNTLKGRLIAVFVLTGLIGLGTLGILAIQRSGTALTAAAEKEGIALTSSVGEMIDSYIKSEVAAVDLLASSVSMRSMNWETQKTFIEQVDINVTGIQEIWVVDEKGQARYLDGTTLDLENRDYVKEALSTGKTALSDPVKSKKTGEMVIVVASPIFEEGKSRPSALLCGSIPLKSLQKTVDKYSWGQTGYIFAIDRKGIVVLHPNEEHQGTLNASVESKAIPAELVEIVKKGMRGESGVEGYPFEGKEKLAAYAPSEFTGWLIFSSAYLDEFTAPVIRMRNTIALITLGLILAIVVVSFFIARSIATPVEKAVQAMGKIAKGDLDITIEDRSSIKELKQLRQAVDAMTSEVSSALSVVNESARTVLDRAQDVNAAVEEANATSDQILEQTVRGNEMAQNTASAVEQTNASISEVAEGAQSGAQNAVEAGEAAENTSHEAEKGTKALNAMVSVIDDVSSAGTKVGDAIKSLDDSVDSIGQFVTTITTIADQTNLLALNAAIEAARAGEHGRGFAVVAEEVRKLAEESNKAAQNVGTLIQEIISRTKTAASDQERSATLIGELVKRTDETKEVFTQVVVRMNGITENVQSIAAAAEEQSASTQEMASGVEHISTNTKNIAEALKSITHGMEEESQALEMMARSAEELVSLSDDMEKAVAHFRLRSQKALDVK
ncbi:methyl-accepting chemotaxis protein [Dethiosulfovibrio sp. F2B]|uniref:methyl-accepting chemotaxis protein n=1 Tax=Dethiosulfovibrio faecalis TaxID=2720018 RepID=UPI001F34F31F|nr:methyl-accepting chemotaxis protein [Dethiosulfovibrio faecalis]MCF4152279.1 methyl-accepting chemotaxis protein [Dethiosulfovibrio faecalis]